MAAPTKPTKTAPSPRVRSTHDAAEDSPQAQPIPGSASLLTAFTGVRRVPPPVNEPIKSYAPGSPERAELKARLGARFKERP